MLKLVPHARIRVSHSLNCRHFHMLGLCVLTHAWKKTSLQDWDQRCVTCLVCLNICWQTIDYSPSPGDNCHHVWMSCKKSAKCKFTWIKPFDIYNRNQNYQTTQVDLKPSPTIVHEIQPTPAEMMMIVPSIYCLFTNNPAQVTQECKSCTWVPHQISWSMQHTALVSPNQKNLTSLTSSDPPMVNIY